MTGLVCPACGARFRAGFERCASCKVDLVDPSRVVVEVHSEGGLAGKKTVALTSASLTACREVERALNKAKIPCAVVAEDPDGVLAAGALKVSVVIAEDDLARANALMLGQFEAMLKREGVGSFNTEAVNVDAGAVTCPACGHSGALKNGECSDCGLFLGAN
jgi:hypothetical protein